MNISKARWVILSVAAILAAALSIPVGAVPAPSAARITVGSHGFIQTANLAVGNTLTVNATGFDDLNGSGRTIEFWQCESNRFVLSNGYDTSSGNDFRNVCILHGSVAVANSGLVNASFDITNIQKTFNSTGNSTAINCDTAPFPGYATSAQNRPGACGIFAVLQRAGTRSTTARWFAPISFHGNYPCLGGTPTVVGTFYDDTIDRSAQTAGETIVDPYGVNTIHGGSGADNICTGGLVDVINAGAGNDRVDAGAGNDRIAGGRFSDGTGATNPHACTTTGTGNDAIVGGPGGDTINGCDGSNRLFGDSGTDHLYLGLGASLFGDGMSGTDFCYDQTPLVVNDYDYRNCENALVAVPW